MYEGVFLLIGVYVYFGFVSYWLIKEKKKYDEIHAELKNKEKRAKK